MVVTKVFRIERVTTINKGTMGEGVTDFLCFNMVVGFDFRVLASLLGLLAILV